MNQHRQRDIRDDLFKRLRASEPYLADNGFTASVISRLPKQTALSQWKKNGLIILFGLIGLVLAASMLPLQITPVAALAAMLTDQIVKLEVFGFTAAATFTLAGAALWFTQHEI